MTLCALGTADATGQKWGGVVVKIREPPWHRGAKPITPRLHRQPRLAAISYRYDRDMTYRGIINIPVFFGFMAGGRATAFVQKVPRVV